MEKLKIYLKQYEKAKILDVGTGRGDFISLIDYLYKDYSEICGIDLVDGLLESNRKAFKDNEKVSFVKDDILNSQLPASSFDIISLSNTLHHLGDINKTIDKMKDLLKDDGIIIINEMFSDNLSKAQVSHRLLHHFAAKVDRIIGRYHDETFTKDDIIRILDESEDLLIEEHWEMEYPDNQVITDVANFHNLIDRLLKMIENSPDFVELKAEGEKIKEYLSENGFKSATQLLVILKKKNIA